MVRVLDERVVIFDPADTGNTHSKGVPDHFRRSRDQRYIFDRVFDQFSSQDEIYEHTAKVTSPSRKILKIRSSNVVIFSISSKE